MFVRSHYTNTANECFRAQVSWRQNINFVWKHFISCCEVKENTELSAQDSKKKYSGKEKCYSIRAVISAVGKLSELLIIYYMANQNFKYVYIVIFWGLKATYLHLSLLISVRHFENQWQQTFSQSLSLFCCLQHPIFSIVLGSCDPLQNNFVSKKITWSSVLLSGMQCDSFDDKAPKGKTACRSLCYCKMTETVQLS